MHGWFEWFFVLIMEIIMFKSHKIKFNQRVLRKNEVVTYGTPIFAPDHSNAIWAAKMCTNSNEYSKYIGFLWKQHCKGLWDVYLKHRNLIYTEYSLGVWSHIDC